MLLEVDWRHPAVEPIRQVEIEQLCVHFIFICGSNILWIGTGNTVHFQSFDGVTKAPCNTLYISNPSVL